MSELSSKVLESRTKAIKTMVGSPGDYEIPKSHNMLSHLTNERAFDDYTYDNARKLVKQQEELLRNLSKVRQQMEMEEENIGKTKDYFSGSRKKKFGHTLDKADKLRQKREDTQTPVKSVEEVLYDTRDGDEQSKNFNTEIQRLRNQVSTIANRYKETDGTGAPNYYYEPNYYPGASYVRIMYPELEDDPLVSVPEMASYFPLTRYTIH